MKKNGKGTQWGAFFGFGGLFGKCYVVSVIEIGQDGFQLFLAADDILYLAPKPFVKNGPQGLLQLGDVAEHLFDLTVPDLVVFQKVVGVHHFSAGALVGCPKGHGNVQVAIVVRELLPGLDVADGNLKIVGRGEAIGVETVVHVAPVVPTEDVVALVVPKGVGVQNVLVDGGHALQFQRGKLAVQFVEHPGNGPCGNEFGGDDAVANFVADKAQFCIGMDHFIRNEFSNEGIKLFNPLMKNLKRLMS